MHALLRKQPRMYCIYSNRHVSNKCGTYDHIFPLSLGGKNQFQIWSDKQCNSQIGSQVDGALVSDPLVELALRNSGVTGRRNKIRMPRWRNSTLNGEPIQVNLGMDKVSVWSAKENRMLKAEEVVGQKINTTLKIGSHTCLRFVAKVVLAGGYFVYGEDFLNATNCDHLRTLIFLDPEREKRENTLEDCEIKYCDRFHPDSKDPSAAGVYRSLSESIGRSIFISIPHESSISFHIGVVGQYIGSMIVPAKTTYLPKEGDHDLGHCIILGPGIMERTSHRAILEEFLHAIISKTDAND